jgi:hypothetical protein
MDDPETENPTWAAIKTTLERSAVAFTARPLAVEKSTLLVTAPLEPGLALVIDRHGRFDFQVGSAIREEFTVDQLDDFLAGTLPQLLAAIREKRITDEVELDAEGRVCRAWTRIDGKVPPGLRETNELIVRRAARSPLT